MLVVRYQAEVFPPLPLLRHSSDSLTVVAPKSTLCHRTPVVPWPYDDGPVVEIATRKAKQQSGPWAGSVGDGYPPLSGQTSARVGGQVDRTAKPAESGPGAATEDLWKPR